MRRISKYIKRLRYKLLKLISRKISVQMLIILVLMVTVPLSILGALLINTSQNAIRASVLRGHRELASRAASEVELFIKKPRDLLSTTASILGSISANSNAWRQETVLVELALNNPMFSRVSSINKNGLEIATSDLGSRLKDVSQEPAFIHALSGELYMSDIYLQSDRTPYMKIAVPIKTLGEVVGVLLAEVNLREVWDIVDRIKLDETGMAYVVSDKGILIAHPDKKRVVANENIFLGNGEIARSLLNNKIGSLEYLDENGQRRISSFAPISDLGWKVVVTQEANEAFAYSSRMKAYSWTLIILSELIAIIISILIAKALVRPIKALADSTRQVAQGRFDEYIPFRRKDELGVLVFSFNNMIKKLKETQVSERLSIIGKAATAIVHELKNSLVMVNTFVELFPRRYNDKKFVERFAKTIPQELQRWKSMLQDLSDFSRGTKLDFSFDELDVAALMRDIHCLIEERAAQSNIRLEVHIQEGLPRIQGNSQKLKQVLINLVTNAIEAMSNQGSLIVSATAVDREGVQKSKYIEIKVRDTGKGIPVQHIEKIFEPFHTTKANGMGLGLAISRNIVQQHGGDIKVESESDKGTSFIIKLPVSRSPVE